MFWFPISVYKDITILLQQEWRKRNMAMEPGPPCLPASRLWVRERPENAAIQPLKARQWAARLMNISLFNLYNNHLLLYLISIIIHRKDVEVQGHRVIAPSPTSGRHRTRSPSPSSLLCQLSGNENKCSEGEYTKRLPGLTVFWDRTGVGLGWYHKWKDFHR